MKSKTSKYYICVGTKFKHVVLFLPPLQGNKYVFKYEYVKKRKRNAEKSAHKFSCKCSVE